MTEFSADKMRETIDILNENMDLKGHAERIQSSRDDLEYRVESYLKFHKNKGMVLKSALERVNAIKQRNPNSVDRIEKLEQRFVTRVHQATDQETVNQAYKALLDTLDREKLI